MSKDGKKIIIFLAAGLIISGGLSFSQPANAAGEYTKSFFWSNLSKGLCPDGNQPVDASGCKDLIKASGQTNCCFGLQSGEGGAAAETPKFNTPEFQVEIPGMAKLSDVSCSLGEDQKFTCSVPWISEYISGLYRYGLYIGGILATIIIMIGGLIWIVSGGDASRINTAKKLIVGSIIGLFLLVSMYLILNFINPDLVKESAISLTYIQDVEPNSDDGNPYGSTECNNCSSLSPIRYKNGGQVNSELQSKLLKAWNASNGISWRVTEAYPPTSQHASKCHYNGMCADIALFNDSGKNYCQRAMALKSILESQGLKVLSEYVSCGGKKTTFGKGEHLHVQLQ